MFGKTCLLVLWAMLACPGGSSESASKPAAIAQSSPKATHLWDTPEGLITPESVHYDSVRNVIYVANINGKPTEKDGNGFISKLTPDGRIETLQWVSGLNAPKGMGIVDGRLFVTDIDQVVAIDIDGGRIARRYPVKDAVFLNDIAIAPDKSVYISDMSTRKIHRIRGDSLETWLEMDAPSPNGLFVEGGYLLVGTQGNLYRVSLVEKTGVKYIEGTGSIDGLAPDGRGGYVISDWSGLTQIIYPDKVAVVLLDTGADGINAADIDYIPSMRLLLIPTFFDNRVRAYRIEYD